MPFTSKKSNIENSSLDLESILEERSVEYSPGNNPLVLKTPAPSRELAEIMQMYNNLSKKYEKLEEELKNQKSEPSSPPAKNKKKVINSRSKDIDTFLNSIKKRPRNPFKTRKVALEDSFFYGNSQSAVKIDQNQKIKILSELEEFDEEEADTANELSKISINISELASKGKEIQCSIKIGNRAITVKGVKKANLSLERGESFKCTRIE